MPNIYKEFNVIYIEKVPDIELEYIWNFNLLCFDLMELTIILWTLSK